MATKTTNPLAIIQAKLKAPKGQYNNFGKYKYRSCEDILEAVKPILAEVGYTLTLNDEATLVGDRYYIKATATLKDENGKIVEQTTALAREAERKSGMDESQITGTASSYARKYALNGLFCIDDTKDADALNTSKDYTDPKKNAKTDEYAEAFAILKPEIATAATIEQLKAINEKNPQFHSYAPYKQEVNKRFKELQAK